MILIWGISRNLLRNALLKSDKAKEGAVAPPLCYLLFLQCCSTEEPSELGFCVPCRVWQTFALSSGTRTISSSSSQSRASHIKSKCSRFTLSASSWYNSLIVFARMPVRLERSACVNLSSPSFFDSKILIITITPSVVIYHFMVKQRGF